MRGLKYLLNNLRHWQTLLVGVPAGFLVLPFAFRVDFGNEEYIYPKAFLCLISLFFTMVFVANACRDVSHNRLVPSFPIARELYTRSIPAFIVIFTLVPMALLLSAYFTFLASINAEEAQYSDTLFCAAVMCGSLLITAPPLVKSPVGIMLSIYAAGFAFAGAVTFTKGSLANGFGLPLWLSAAILAAVVGVGTVWAFVISGVMYSRRKVKIRPEVRV